MTRKDYVAIAAALAKTRPDGPLARFDQHEEDCAAIASVLARDNPRFDRAKFLRACGVVQ